MEYDSNYAPVTVRFDASKSFIKNDDIIKFIYDYGDGISEERDSINPGHKYIEAGDYTVSLTVI
jgi:PKD repeat protein